MKFWKQTFLGIPFFIGMSLLAVGFVFGFFFPVMFQVSQFLLIGFIFLCFFDFALLYMNQKGISGERKVQERLSNGDINKVELRLQNHLPYQITYKIYEELPVQFQLFDFALKGKLSAHKESQLHYELIPNDRGIYQFGNSVVMVQTPLGILQRKLSLPTSQTVKVYPSFLKLNQHSLHNFKAHTQEIGQKKIRRIGHSMEFEQIKNYVIGDDFRTINWKATAKHQKLMVNQYVDEKSQQVYCAIDKGRLMKMPFKEMSLLDYSINTSLVVSNIVLQNQDRAGIFTFSRQIENFIKAERRNHQLSQIMESLYNIQSNFKESDFGKLYNTLKFKIPQRSLILLFTNFESLDSLHRQLPYLQGINRNHLLVVVFFRNVELEEFLKTPEAHRDVYEKTIVEKFLYEKHQIVLELHKHGIQTILTAPEELTVATINKYLEIKSRGML